MTANATACNPTLTAVALAVISARSLRKELTAASFHPEENFA